MARYLLASLLVLTLGVALAAAKTIKVPDDKNPAASLTFPDSWKQTKIETGVEAQSSDGAVYMAIVVVENEESMDAEIEDTFAMLKEKNVELDESTKKENKFKLAGFDAEEILFQGKDEDGPAAVSITFVPLNDKVLVLTYWVSTSEEAKHSDDIGKILRSIKAL